MTLTDGRALARGWMAAVLAGGLAGATLASGIPGARAQEPESSDVLPRITSTERGVIPGESPAVTHPRTNARPVLAGPVDADHYVVGPGDVLSVEYGGRATGSTTLIVDSEGRVRVPNLGLVELGGRTLDAARAEILRRLRPYLPGAALDVRLLTPRSFKVFVLGEVKQPGAMEVVGSARVLEAIEAAGGQNEEGSSRNVRVIRRDGRMVPADLERFRRVGDWDANPFLEDGDRIVVPVAVERMGVFGAVARPGFVEYRPGDSLATALRLAGGLRPQARTDSLLLVRFVGAKDMDSLYIPIEPGLGGAGAATLLQADDRVFIRPQPEWRQARQVAITGEVLAPGTYAIVEGESRLSDLIRWAGGFTAGAARRNVKIERHLPQTAERDVEFDRLSRLSRSEMTNTEYQVFLSKLALRQSVYLVDFSTGRAEPPEANIQLRDGDRIDVNRLELAVRLDGSVRSPGFVAYEPGRSVGDYIRMAGGATKRANVRDARLTRAGSSLTMLARDARRIEPGDFIWVPEKKDTNAWAVFRDALIVAGQVATIVLVIDQLRK